MRKLIVFLTLVLMSTFSFAQYDFAMNEDILWGDSHELINSDLAVKSGIVNREIFVTRVTNGFNSLKKQGIIDAKLCDLYHIDTYVDFIDYLLGYWDTDFSTETPERVQAGREDDADAILNECWTRILLYIKLKQENPTMEPTGLAKNIKYDLDTITSFDVVHDLSPALRVTLPDKVRVVKRFLQKLNEN